MLDQERVAPRARGGEESTATRCGRSVGAGGDGGRFAQPPDTESVASRSAIQNTRET